MTKQGEVVRTVLFQIIRADPGIHVRRLAHVAGIAGSTCEHHVRHLEREDKVRRIRVQGRWRVYAGEDVWASSLESIVLMHDGRNRHILDVVRAQPGLRQDHLSQAAGLPMSTLCRRIRRLERSGLVRRPRSGHERRVFPCDDAKILPAWTTLLGVTA